MRKLATVRRIDDIRYIQDADSIECAVVGGWTVVVKKGDYIVGDLAVYVEIDSWVPHDIAPFLSKGQEPREYEGIKGERLRTVKLRGQLSQGLLLPLSVVIGREKSGNFEYTSEDDLYEGEDVSDLLGIVKWEAPIPAQLAGTVRGPFPSGIPKTDQERIQNLSAELEDWKARRLNWEVTEKLDGTSMTVFLDSNGQFGVCGRNWELAETDTNSLWRAARADDLETKMRKFGRAIAIQGELVGEGIQGNPYKLKGQQFYVYDVYDIAEGRYWSAMDRWVLTANFDIKQVPFIGSGELDADIPTLLRWAEGKSKLCETAEREGLVYKCMEDPSISFKAISNKFLIKTGG